MVGVSGEHEFFAPSLPMPGQEAGGIIRRSRRCQNGDLIRATHERFREAGERYGTDAGDMTVCKVVEDDAGVELRVAGDWVAPWEVAQPDDRS